MEPDTIVTLISPDGTNMQAQKIAKVSILAGLAMLTLTCNVAVSAPRSKAVKIAASASQGTDESAVRSKITTLRDHATKHDAKAMSNLWAVDGIYIDESGNKAVGRESVEKIFSENFAKSGQSNQMVPIEVAVDTVRFPAASVALADGTVKRKSEAGLIPTTRYSMVLLKQKGGEWLISSATEAPIDGPNVAVNPLESLQWLIGDWSSVREGQSVNMKADWVPAKNFITCKFEIKKGNETPKVETQIIGWDPRNQAPVSWNFDSSGGFGTGLWSKRNNQWLVNASGVERDGSTSTATNVFSNAGPNDFSWQAVNRHLDGVPVADTTIVKVQRVK